jgi:8-amino-7-oxononanoate synthase
MDSLRVKLFAQKTNMNTLNNRLLSRIQARKKSGEYRTLQVFHEKIDFFSNDYLGLGRSSRHITQAVSNSGSSRLIAGTTNQHLELELLLAEKFKAESALIYNSGYAANVGLFSAIGLKDTVVLYDEYVHTSIKDGIRLGFGRGYSFKHNDSEHLQQLLQKHRASECIVVTETLFSMHGDFAPVLEISQLCTQYKALLIIDEAHSAGVFGKAGFCDTLGITDVLFARVFTFGKAYGSVGACIVGSTTLIDYLINFSRSFIYTTALPAQLIADAKEKICSLDLKKQQHLLFERIEQFRREMNPIALTSAPVSPIQCVLIGDVEKAKCIEKKLLEKHIGVKAILSPTVPEGQECLRISLHSFNTEQEILTLVKQLKELL